MAIEKDPESGLFFDREALDSAVPAGVTRVKQDEETGLLVPDTDPAPRNPKPQNDSGLVMSAINRGSLTSAGLLAKGVGADEFGGKLLEASKRYPARYGSYEDVNGIGDALGFATETVLENSPNLALIAAGSLVGGEAAALAGVGRLGTTIAEGLGAASVDYPMLRGETKQQQEDAGIAPEDQKTLIAPALKASLDLVPFMAVAKKMGILPSAIDRAVVDAGVKSGFFKPTLGKLGKVIGYSAAEGGTEALQEFIDQAQVNLIKEGEILKPNDQEWKDIINAGIKGAVGMSPFATYAAFHGEHDRGFAPEEDIPQPVAPPSEQAAETAVGGPPADQMQSPQAPVAGPTLTEVLDETTGPQREPGVPPELPPRKAIQKPSDPVLEGYDRPDYDVRDYAQEPPDVDPRIDQRAEAEIPKSLSEEETVEKTADRSAAARASSGVDSSFSGRSQIAKLWGTSSTGTAVNGIPRYFLTNRDTTEVSKREGAQRYYVPIKKPVVVTNDEQLLNLIGLQRTEGKFITPRDVLTAFQNYVRQMDLRSAANPSHIILRPEGDSVLIQSALGGRDQVIPTARGAREATATIARPSQVRPLPDEPMDSNVYRTIRNTKFPVRRVPGDPLEATAPQVTAGPQRYAYSVHGGQHDTVLQRDEMLKDQGSEIAQTQREGSNLRLTSSMKPGDVTVVFPRLEQDGFSPFQDRQTLVDWTHARVSEMVRRFNPRGKYIVIFKALQGNLGEAAFDTTTNTSIIYMNPLTIESLEGFHSVLAHEFGHTMVWEVFRHMPAAVKNGVMREYVNWLNSVQDMTVTEFWYNYGSVGHQQHLGIWSEKYGASTKIRDLPSEAQIRIGNYFSNFHEWSAQMFNRAFERDTSQDPFPPENKYLAKYFRELVTALRQFYAWAKSQISAHNANASTKWESSFPDYLKLVELRWQLGAPREESGMASPNVPAQSLAAAEAVNDLTLEARIEPGERRKLNAQLDTFGAFHKWTHSLLQIAQKNRHIEGLQRYVLAVQKFWADKTAITSKANDTLHLWNKLGKDQEGRLAKFLFDLTMKSMELNRRMNVEEKVKLAKAHGLGPDALEVYRQIDENMRDVLVRMKQAAVEDVLNVFPDPTSQEALSLISRIQKDFAKLENQDYFPLTRFGQYAVIIRAKQKVTWGGQHFNPGDVMAFETYENEREQGLRASALKAQFPSNAVGIAETYLEDAGFSFQGFPPSLLENFKDQLGLTADQIEKFRSLVVNLSPGQSFRKHMLRRRGVAGFSVDAKRAYSSYMMHAGNHLSRIINYRELTNAMTDVSQDVRAINDDFGNSVTRGKLHEYMLQHYDYLMNPGNEWAQLRAATFLWYLGFNIKSAMVNLTQLPLFTYNYLASRHGDIGTSKTMIGAMRDVVNSVLRPGVLKPDELALMTRARDAGFIDESFASDLAATAEGATMSRFTAGTVAQRATRRISYLGSLPFHAIETFQRRVTFLSAIRLAKRDGLDMEAQFAAGREAVQSTMFEYARWNKPLMMRGKKSVVFVFMNFLQHALYFAAHDQARARFLLTMLVAAGVQGLPGAEDILDLIDWSATWLKRILGMNNPRVDTRLELRKLVKEIGLDPDLAMYGLSRSSFGLSFLGDALGIPVPEVNMQSSLSMGRVVPGVEQFTNALLRGRSATDAIGQSAQNAAGATVGIGMALLQSITSNSADEWKRWENALPISLKNISKAARWASRGKETNSLGDQLVEFDPEDTQQMAEIVAAGLGFAPTRLAKEREIDLAQKDMAQYYMTRRTTLMGQYFYARKANDREALADVRDRVKQFNSTAPKPELRISNSDLARSFKQRLRSQRLREKGVSDQRRLRGLYQEIEQDYR